MAAVAVVIAVCIGAWLLSAQPQPPPETSPRERPPAKEAPAPAPVPTLVQPKAPAEEPPPPADTAVPDLPSAELVQMAEELTDAGDFAAAERYYSRLIEVDPDGEFTQLALYKLAGFAWRRGELDQAIADMQRVLTWHGDPDPTNRVTQGARHDLEQLYDEVRARAGH
ncbi:MAG: tetratricopeptide (TPR) repeat protein [Myxococcota bacterium]|jgi:tetratricopeptide (TPR) repeat protein